MQEFQLQRARATCLRIPQILARRHIPRRIDYAADTAAKVAGQRSEAWRATRVELA
jgi:hypothetical protein